MSPNRRSRASLAVTLALVTAATGCEIIATFDRGKITSEADASSDASYDATYPEGGGSDGVAPETGADTSTPDTGPAPDGGLDSSQVDTGADANVTDSNVADTKGADANVADTNVADTNIADTNVADTNVADTTPPSDAGDAGD